MPSALDELNHADAVAAAEHPQRKAEGGRRFPLARTGMHDQKALLDRLFGDLGVLHGFALRHLGAMALGRGFIGGLGHGRPFTNNGNPATMRTTRSARAASRWLMRPCRSRNSLASALSGTIPHPTSLATSTVCPEDRINTASRFAISVSTS